MLDDRQRILQDLTNHWHCDPNSKFWGRLIFSSEVKHGTIVPVIERASIFGQQGKLTVPKRLSQLTYAGRYLTKVRIDKENRSLLSLEAMQDRMVAFNLKIHPLYMGSETLTIFATDLEVLTEEDVQDALQANEDCARLEQARETAHKSLEEISLEVDQQRNTLAGLQRDIEEQKKLNDELIAAQRKLDQQMADKRRQIDWFRRVGLLSEKSIELPAQACVFEVDAAPEAVDWKLAINRISAYIAGRGGIYPLSLLKHFTALMRTHDMVVFAGRSGTGKTSFCRLFAAAIGADLTVIPVKPNWVGSDDLLGYLNPVDKTYVTTPFVEALNRARRSPEMMHFIVLDEMNIARPEYYLADALSVLEDRTSTELSLGSIGSSSLDEKVRFTNERLSRLLTELYPSGSIPQLGELIKQHRADLAQQFGCSPEKVEDCFIKFAGDAAQHSAASENELIVPDNVRLIGTINIDESTNFFSPKVLDRVFLVRLDDPLSLFGKSLERCQGRGDVFAMSARCFGKRSPYPEYDPEDELVKTLIRLAQPMRSLGIDMSLRLLRQAMHYRAAFRAFDEEIEKSAVNIIRSKLMPRMVFDAEDASVRPSKSTKHEVLSTFVEQMKESFSDSDLLEECSDLLAQADTGDHQVNYWAL